MSRTFFFFKINMGNLNLKNSKLEHSLYIFYGMLMLKNEKLVLPIAIILRLNPTEISKKSKKFMLPTAETDPGLVCQTGVGPVGRVPVRHWNE